MNGEDWDPMSGETEPYPALTVRCFVCKKAVEVVNENTGQKIATFGDNCSYCAADRFDPWRQYTTPYYPNPIVPDHVLWFDYPDDPRRFATQNRPEGIDYFTDAPGEDGDLGFEPPLWDDSDRPTQIRVRLTQPWVHNLLINIPPLDPANDDTVRYIVEEINKYYLSMGLPTTRTALGSQFMMWGFNLIDGGDNINTFEVLGYLYIYDCDPGLTAESEMSV